MRLLRTVWRLTTVPIRRVVSLVREGEDDLHAVYGENPTGTTDRERRFWAVGSSGGFGG